MNLSQFRRMLLQVFLVPLVVLGLVACAVYLQLHNANQAFELIRRSDSRIAQLSLVARLILDEESGLRGFEATSDPHFLDPYRGTQARIKSTLQSLEKTPGAPSPEGRPYHGIADLESSYLAWHTRYADPMFRAARPGDYVQSTARDLEGKLLMDRVRVQLDAAHERAEQRRAERITVWQQQTRLTEIALFALTLGTGLLIGFFSRNRLHAVSAAYGESVAKLNQRNDDLYQSEQKMLTTLGSIGDGVIACDIRGCVELMNQVAEQLTGWPLSEARGRLLDEVVPLLEEQTRTPLESHVHRLQQHAVAGNAPEHVLLRRRDGSELPVADSGALIRAQDGSMQGVVVVFRDVSGERRTREALLTQERLATAGRLAATIAHEIHNPLHHVGDLLYLLRDGVSPEENTRFLTMASAELDRVTEISRAMLGLHRESAAPIDIDLREAIHDVLLLLERRAAEVGVLVEADLPAGALVRGFPAELKQVITNLITNAVEAAGKDGEIFVCVGHPALARGTRQQVEILVRDNGPGIPDEVLKTLFQPFVTTKGEHGTGLGLWVSRGIVAKHGGTLDLESQTGENHGTVARVLLPGMIRAAAEAQAR